jgi:colicin import membrane protein
LSDGSEKSGFYVSGALHAALLGMLVFGFTQAPKFDDAAESIPVETITQSQLNEIMHGEKDAKPSKTPPAPPQRQLAAIEPPAPPEPPPDLRRVDDTPPPPEPPQPPAKPAPPPPEPPTPPVKPPPPEPTPPVKPQPPKPSAEEAPEPPVKVRTVEKPPEKPKPEPPERPKADPLAKLLAREKTESSPKETAKSSTKPQARPFDPNAISKLIGQTKLADATPTGATPQGLPTQHAARMSPTLSSSLDAWFTEAYLGCWSPPPTMPEGERYVADVRVIFNPDGSLSGQPQLLNPPRDPAWRAHAESAVRAVLKCNPLHVPPQYAPYFEQWKSKTIHFDPQDALG